MFYTIKCDGLRIPNTSEYCVVEPHQRLGETFTTIDGNLNKFGTNII